MMKYNITDKTKYTKNIYMTKPENKYMTKI